MSIPRPAVDLFTDEVLRLESPINCFTRHATAPATIGGVT